MLKFLISMKTIKKKQASRRRRKKGPCNCMKLKINMNVFCFVLFCFVNAFSLYPLTNIVRGSTFIAWLYTDFMSLHMIQGNHSTYKLPRIYIS